jgi:hypothetical protein
MFLRSKRVVLKIAPELRAHVGFVNVAKGPEGTYTK